VTVSTTTTASMQLPVERQVFALSTGLALSLPFAGVVLFSSPGSKRRGRKIGAVLLLAVMALALQSCGGGGASTPPQQIITPGPTPSGGGSVNPSTTTATVTLTGTSGTITHSTSVTLTIR